MVANRLAGSWRRWLGIGGAVVLLAACQPSMEEVVSRHRDAVERVFGQLRALDDPARSAPRLQVDGFSPDARDVVLEGGDSNAVFLPAEVLASPEFTPSDGHGSTQAYAMRVCGEALRGEAGGVPAGVAAFLEECARARHAFVLRTHVDEAAELVGGDGFRPGRYEGEVLLFRLEDGALLGGVRILATSSDQVMARAGADGAPADVADRLRSDLESNVFAAIQDQLRRHLPGAVP